MSRRRRPSARGPADILIDVATGAVLAARNADEPVAPASLTKMMTLYLTFRAIEAGQLKLDSRLEVSRRAAAMPPTKLGLKAGSTIEVEDAILGLVTRSANDAASVLAEALGGTEDRFASVMTRTRAPAGDDQDRVPQCLRPAGWRAAHHGARPRAAGDAPDRGLSRLLPLLLAPQLRLCRAAPTATTTGCSPPTPGWMG